MKIVWECYTCFASCTEFWWKIDYFHFWGIGHWATGPAQNAESPLQLTMGCTVCQDKVTANYGMPCQANMKLTADLRMAQ